MKKKERRKSKIHLIPSIQYLQSIRIINSMEEKDESREIENYCYTTVSSIKLYAV
jgi:hypothetical protein